MTHSDQLAFMRGYMDKTAEDKPIVVPSKETATPSKTTNPVAQGVKAAETFKQYTPEEMSDIGTSITEKYKGNQGAWAKAQSPADIQRFLRSSNHYMNTKMPEGYNPDEMAQMLESVGSVGDAIQNPWDAMKIGWKQVTGDDKFNKWKSYYAGQQLKSKMGENAMYMPYMSNLAKTNPKAAQQMMVNAAQGNKARILMNSWGRGDMDKLMATNPKYAPYAKYAKMAYNNRYLIGALGAGALGLGAYSMMSGDDKPQQPAPVQQPQQPMPPGMYDYRGIR